MEELVLALVNCLASSAIAGGADFAWEMEMQRSWSCLAGDCVLVARCVLRCWRRNLFGSYPRMAGRQVDGLTWEMTIWTG